MLDRYLTGRAERVSPEAPVPVVRVEGEREVPGGAANVALGIRALGAACRLVGVVGEDPAGRRLREAVGAAKLDGAHLVPDAARPTTVKTRVLARRQQMLRIDRESAEPLAGPIRGEVLEAAAAALAWADALVLADYDKGLLAGGLGREILAKAAEAGVPSVVDPKRRHFFDYPGATVLKPNVRELAGALGLEAAPAAADLPGLARSLGCRNLLVTLGEEGMLLAGADLEGVVRISAHAREVYDVTGAGDTVTAVLAAALAGGAALRQAALLANFAAGLEVARLGAVPVGRNEILEGLAAGGGVPEARAAEPGSGGPPGREPGATAAVERTGEGAA